MNQLVEFPLGPGATSVMIIEGNAKGLGQIAQMFGIVIGKIFAVLFIDELDDTHHGILELDRSGQHLAGSHPAFWIPGCVELQVRIDGLQFLFTADVVNMEQFARYGDVTGNARSVHRDTDLSQIPYLSGASFPCIAWSG